MSKKRKVRVDRIIILVLLGLLVTVLLGFGAYKLIDYLMNRSESDPNKPEVIVNPGPVETNDDVKVSLVDYEVYRSQEDNFEFNFIIAELNFKAKDPISFDLGNLQTSEKIYLNNVSKYVNELEEKGYKVSKLGVVNNVASEKNDYSCKLFIPFTTTSSSLRLLNSKDASMIQFDLDAKQKDISTLKFNTEQQIEVGNTNVTVSSSYISTMMIHNGERYTSNIPVYTFKINVNKVEGNVMITDAKFIRNSNDEIISCMLEDYESVQDKNCLGKKLVEGDNGALFFEALPGEDNPDLSGSLMLMFSNSNDWVKIPTVLE